MEGLRVSTTTDIEAVSTVALAMAAVTDEVNVSFFRVFSTCSCHEKRSEGTYDVTRHTLELRQRGNTYHFIQYYKALNAPFLLLTSVPKFVEVVSLAVNSVVTVNSTSQFTSSNSRRVGITVPPLVLSTTNRLSWSSPTTRAVATVVFRVETSLAEGAVEAVTVNFTSTPTVARVVGLRVGRCVGSGVGTLEGATDTDGLRVGAGVGSCRNMVIQPPPRALFMLLE
jgi:hypothetical protein